eukprot:scaffold38308_cov67-Phaeocystis_antarctica.AAC.3
MLPVEWVERCCACDIADILLILLPTLRYTAVLSYAASMLSRSDSSAAVLVHTDAGDASDLLMHCRSVSRPASKQPWSADCAACVIASAAATRRRCSSTLIDCGLAGSSAGVAAGRLMESRASVVTKREAGTE